MSENKRDLKDLLADLDWDKEGNLVDRKTREPVISAEWIDGSCLCMPEELQNFFITNGYGALLERALKLEKTLDDAIKTNKYLEEENDLQRDSIQKLSAQGIAYRDMLQLIEHYFRNPSKYDGTWSEFYAEKIKLLLDDPNPGADLLDKIAKLEAIAEATEKMYTQIIANSHAHSLDMSGYHGTTIRIKQGESGKDFWQAMWAYNDALAAYEGSK